MSGGHLCEAEAPTEAAAERWLAEGKSEGETEQSCKALLFYDYPSVSLTLDTSPDKGRCGFLLYLSLYHARERKMKGISLNFRHQDIPASDKNFVDFQPSRRANYQLSR